MHFNRTINIGNHIIGDFERCFIIAEAGVNHNGDLDTAKRMIDAAAECGVDAIKFQAFHTNDLVLRDAVKAPYQRITTNSCESQYEMLKKLETSIGVITQLKAYSESKGLVFLCTPFESNSLNELVAMGITAIKIAATDATNISFLRAVAQKGIPIILSAGMCYLEEIRIALESIYPYNSDVVLLQCTANYPIRDVEANLNVLDTFKKEFDVLIGYSDHSSGVGAAPYAVAKGAKIIEKHFTLSRKCSGPDQMASVEPDELAEMVKEIRKVERYLGSAIKKPTISEVYTRQSLQKCLVASRDIKTGETFSDENIVGKRTNGIGIPALYADELYGEMATRDYQLNDIVEIN